MDAFSFTPRNVTPVGRSLESTWSLVRITVPYPEMDVGHACFWMTMIELGMFCMIVDVLVRVYIVADRHDISAQCLMAMRMFMIHQRMIVDVLMVGPRVPYGIEHSGQTC